MAILGGVIEPGERASREVEEEMSVICDEMHPLGCFRTDVNRGIGWVHSFLATRCQSLDKKKAINGKVVESKDDQIGDADVERQDLIKVSLKEVLRAATRNGDFLEVQWSNTVGLALMHPELAGTDS